MQVPRGQVDDVVARAWQWMKSDPKNMTAVLSLPLVLGQMVSEWRWHRTNAVPWLSAGGTVAYMKARPLQAALGVVFSLLPEIVSVIVKVGRSGDRVARSATLPQRF